MTTDIEFRLRDHYAKLADEVQVPEMTFEDLLADRTERVHRATLDATQPGTGAIQSLVDAGSRFGGARGGRAGGSRLAPSAASTPTIRRRLRSARSRHRCPKSTTCCNRNGSSPPPCRQIGQWLYGLASTDGVLGDAGGSGQFSRRVSWYGTKRFDGESEQLSVAVDALASVPEGEAVEISGTTWTVSAWTPGQWTATRQLASSTVTVTGRGRLRRRRPRPAGGPGRRARIRSAVAGAR